MSQNSLPGEEVNVQGQRDFLFLKDNAMVPSRPCDAGSERFLDTAVHPPSPCLRLSPRASVESASGAPSCCECEGRGWQGKWRKGLLSLSLSLSLWLHRAGIQSCVDFLATVFPSCWYTTDFHESRLLFIYLFVWKWRSLYPPKTDRAREGSHWGLSLEVWLMALGFSTLFNRLKATRMAGAS